MVCTMNLVFKKSNFLQAFSKYINEIWCIDLVFLDKLASQNNECKYLLVAVDNFSRFVRVQTMKQNRTKTLCKL